MQSDTPLSNRLYWWEHDLYNPDAVSLYLGRAGAPWGFKDQWFDNVVKAVSIFTPWYSNVVFTTYGGRPLTVNWTTIEKVNEVNRIVEEADKRWNYVMAGDYLK